MMEMSRRNNNQSCCRGAVILCWLLRFVHGQRINEFQPNPFGSDPAQQFIELKGSSEGAIFVGCVVFVDCDTDTGIIDRTEAVSGTFDINRLLTVPIADVENPSFILLVVVGTCPTVGSSPIGQLSSVNVVDAIGVPDSVADEARCALSSIDSSLSIYPTFSYTGDEPKLIFRDNASNAWYAVNDPDRGNVYDIQANVFPSGIFVTGGNPLEPSFGAPNPGSDLGKPVINEFEPNPFGSDVATQFVELKGLPGVDFDGCMVSVDCDTTSLTIDRANPISGIFDSQGLIVIPISDLENPSFIFLLVDGDCPPIGVSPTGILSDTTVVDAIGIPDLTTDVDRCKPVSIDASLALFEGFEYTGDEPKLVFRDGVSNDWYAINDPPRGEVIAIDGTAVSTTFITGDPFSTSFGEVNPSVVFVPPEPTATPTERPSTIPTTSVRPTFGPTTENTSLPTPSPTDTSSTFPTDLPSTVPTFFPSFLPTISPTLSGSPSNFPSAVPTKRPSSAPSPYPSLVPTVSPSISGFPTVRTTTLPTSPPSSALTESPTSTPTRVSVTPTNVSTISPTKPSVAPSTTSSSPTKNTAATLFPSEHLSSAPFAPSTNQTCLGEFEACNPDLDSCCGGFVCRGTVGRISRSSKGSGVDEGTTIRQRDRRLKKADDRKFRNQPSTKDKTRVLAEDFACISSSKGSKGSGGTRAPSSSSSPTFISRNKSAGKGSRTAPRFPSDSSSNRGKGSREASSAHEPFAGKGKGTSDDSQSGFFIR